jgi:uncharacterized protein (TIGR02246 family)
MAIPQSAIADSETAAIRHVVAGISTAWRAGRTRELHDFFADDVVLIAPGARARIEGRAAVVETYREFAEHTTQDYRELDLSVDVFGDTAIATFRYEMNNEGGSDVLVLSRRAGMWKVVWRTIVPDS